MVKTTIQLYGFSSVESPEAVKAFLEEYTGEGTVSDVKVRPPNDGKSRSSAIVEFTHAESAEIIIPLADDRRLWYGDSYLKARKWKVDNFEHSMGRVKLHFGCLVSEEQFSVLWTAPDVQVKFGTEFKNIYFSFSYDSAVYKFEVFTESISQMELHIARDQLRKYLLIQINSLVQHGRVPGQALDVTFYKLVDPSTIRIDYIECALDKLFRLKACCYDPVSWLCEQYRDYKSCTRIPETPAISLDDGMVYVHRVQVTPSKVYFCGPEVNLSNRVLRKYPQDIDNFLRVSFVDEDLGKIHSKDLCSRPRTSNTSAEEERRTRVYERIFSTLRNGIVIGDKKFEFLAFSSSQLREHSVWMFASRSELSAQDIRNWMGDFRDIRNVAKYGARLGQAFSSSRETFNVDRDEIELIPDVKIERSGVKYCFSDGIGKISAEFAERVARKCGRSSTPSAFQIRRGGYKGVVAVDPTLAKNLALRESMCKYQSNNTALDVLKWSTYQPCFLNRQLITLLSTLGVPDHVFQRKQTQALNQLEGVLTDPSRAKEALETIFQGEVTDVLKEMLSCGYKPDAEPFLSLTLQAFCASKLMELRTKTRIFVSSGRSMMGCLDETGTLEYGQVFVQCSHRVISTGSAHSNTTSSEEKFVVDGNVVVARNPCLHPGDVRVLTAVDVPALHHMVDCVVFPQKGKRPHPDECSGGDLDGDFYFVSWDSDLIPPWKVRPMNYTPAPTIELDHDVTMEVQCSRLSLLLNIFYGRVSALFIQHLVFYAVCCRKLQSRLQTT
ncbi:RNA-dependent RNA polymerase 1 [Pyrus ussuriensis x Pyrus communis]|uniref:RNA-dependent RNA polymerase n=1 Tax=Pyrus ussuriensis x Pyrus communis TaxID=2448454 RepID=A0A5N5HFP3_9ROSA|nr:RNA-dependent RNA polymerase 1 [Pyrus ussuriensis x Pyrus communis]